MRRDAIIETRNLVSGYGKEIVLHGISLRCSCGETIGITGSNGSGKSTLLRCLAGILPVWSGHVVYAGSTIDGLGVAKRLRLGITYLPREPRVFARLSVRDNIGMTNHAISTTELARRSEELLDEFPWLKSRMHSPAGRFSGGEQTIIALCRILLQRPRLLLLDEPLEGLSANNMDIVRKQIGRLLTVNSCVIFAEQRKSILGELSSRILTLEDGRIY